MRAHFLLPIAISLGLLACSKTPAPPPPDPAALAKAEADAKANKQLALYEQMRTGGSADIAVNLGDEIVKTYPNTAAAAQVQKTLGELRERAKRDSESKRLARL